MMTLIGYSVNASAIELDLHDEEELMFEHEAVRAAVAFWLIIKLTRGEPCPTDTRPPLTCANVRMVVLVLLYYAWRLPLFRKSQILHAVAVFVPMCVYLVRLTPRSV